MIRNCSRLAISTVLALTMAACSSEPSKNQASSTSATQKQAEIKPSDTETGRVALQRLYTTSRGWAGDTLPVSIESQNYKHAGGNPNAPLGHDGKAAVWRGLFGSDSRRMMKTYMWSGLTGSDAPTQGITPGNEDPFVPGNTSTHPFQIAYLKFDSDQALEVAQKHGGADLLKKEAEIPVNFTLGWEFRGNSLVWHVLYGDSPKQPKLDVVVNASSNEFVRVEK